MPSIASDSNKRARFSSISRSSLKFDKCDDSEKFYQHGRVGFILIPTEGIIEREMFKFLPKGMVGCHFARLPLPMVDGRRDPSVSKEALSNMVHDLAPTAGQFAIWDLKVVCFACTSSSFLIGLDKVDEELTKGLKDGGFYQGEDANPMEPRLRLPKVTSLSRAVLASMEKSLWGCSSDGHLTPGLEGSISLACETYPKKNIVILTPYLSEINVELVATFEDHFGALNVLEIAGMGLVTDDDIGRCSHETIYELAVELFDRHCSSGGKEELDDGRCPDMVFISCGALRSIEVIEPLEKTLFAKAGRSIPVLCSNGCMIWHTSRLAGFQGKIDIIGRLGEL